ncbi:AP-4 complex subunit sigma-1 [Desmophyllum pertusum]|uniref:AP complex subunit sigma n=1 Tax=Desmophyllum pertusum TaxID=174260 RepID=A0A9W9ZPE7_9CNID|nr:AP-4 complex subunit sigma-1 [Desmophyllum pertusum]
MLKFLLLVNKQGHTRVSQYYEHMELEERTNMEAEITRKCLARSDDQCPFMEFKNFKVIYRRYASLLFIVGVDSDENELSILEFIHNLVETLDRYFSSVIMFNLDKVHMILDEMIMNGQIVETNKNRILAPISVLDEKPTS